MAGRGRDVTRGVRGCRQSPGDRSTRRSPAAAFCRHEQPTDERRRADRATNRAAGGSRARRAARGGLRSCRLKEGRTLLTPLRLTIVATHPTQYHGPWFRHLQTHHPELDLMVLYASRPSPVQQGVGFDRSFEWDTSLRDGYKSRIVRDAAPSANFSSESF